MRYHSFKLSLYKYSSRKPQKSANGKLLTPSIYVGDVIIPKSALQPQDTFLDPRPWGKVCYTNLVILMSYIIVDCIIHLSN